MEPASKVSVPFTVVMRMRSRVPDKAIFPAPAPKAVEVRLVAAEYAHVLLPNEFMVIVPSIDSAAELAS